jgi:hypothetical protein
VRWRWRRWCRMDAAGPCVPFDTPKWKKPQQRKRRKNSREPFNANGVSDANGTQTDRVRKKSERFSGKMNGI